MVKTIKIKKGLDIPLPGAATGAATTDSTTALFAISPEDYPGYTWKAAVKAGDSVCIGDPSSMPKRRKNSNSHLPWPEQ